MLIQVILLTVFAALLWVIVRQPAVPKLHRTAITLVILLACYVVAFPNVTTVVASVAGVGRGADLIIYVSMAVTTFLIAALYIRSRRNELRAARLVQLLALQDHRIAQIEGRTLVNGPKPQF